MEDFLHLAKSRRSVRKYNGRNIPKEDLELCCEAARQSPSACNSQPWKFIVVDDEKIKKLIAEKVLSGLYNMNTFAASATSYIVMVSENLKLPAMAAGKLLNMDYKRIDVGIACAHLVLQAQELGIGSCILGWFNERKLKKILRVPRGKRIELVIALGYPKEPVTREKRLKEKQEVVSFNVY
ncbi:nitroreductase family protein [Candidatus Omnitrophota bacterium]